MGDSPHKEQAQHQGKKDIPVGQVLPKGGRVRIQRINGLGNQSEKGQPPHIPLDVMGIDKAYCQAVAKEGEGKPSQPSIDWVLREKGAADMVGRHRQYGDQL